MSEPPPVADALCLPRAFPSRYGVPRLTHVAPSVFTRRYFTHCLACGFCHDWCCRSGVDLDLWHHARLVAEADGLEAFTGVPRGEWLEPDTERDPDMPGGGSRRTRLRDGACVFLNRSGRGCLLHAYAASRQIDYHELKPMVDCLFPLTFADGLLCAAEEVDDGELVCLNQGPSLYRGVRDELRYYFGDDCVAALDALERRALAGP
jgi:hypothetical protein